jgi:general nucleoside transport system permease protein
MLRLEPRTEPSRAMVLATPVFAVVATMIAGGLLFAFLGKNPVQAIRIIFWDPIFGEFAFYYRPQLLVKAAPLIMISIGLSFGFRANIWNIGAEGQFVMGAVVGGATGLALWGVEGFWVLPLMVIMGALGGFVWAMIPAFLRIRYNANEILVSLMLVYVAYNFLAAMVVGPLRNPQGNNFPVSRSFRDYASAFNGELFTGTEIHIGVFVTLGVVIAAYIMMRYHILGFQIRVTGQSARAAKFGGISPNMLVAVCLGLSGALSGMAGLFEVTGPAGNLSTTFPQGYGFTAIIVAFLGRLHPIGIALGGLLMALTYVGGGIVQGELGVPAVSIQVFQGMLLFFLLAVDILVNFRIKFKTRGIA